MVVSKSPYHMNLQPSLLTSRPVLVIKSSWTPLDRTALPRWGWVVTFWPNHKSTWLLQPPETSNEGSPVHEGLESPEHSQVILRWLSPSNYYSLLWGTLVKGTCSIAWVTMAPWLRMRPEAADTYLYSTTTKKYGPEGLEVTNMLFVPQMNIKIVNFGLCTQLSGNKLSTFCGSSSYPGPELFLGKKV